MDAFSPYIVLPLSPGNDAANAFNVRFDHWLAKFGNPDILDKDKGTE